MLDVFNCLSLCVGLKAECFISSSSIIYVHHWEGNSKSHSNGCTKSKQIISVPIDCTPERLTKIDCMLFERTPYPVLYNHAIVGILHPKMCPRLPTKINLFTGKAYKEVGKNLPK